MRQWWWWRRWWGWKRGKTKNTNEKGAFKLQVSVNNPIFNNKPFNTNNLIKEIKNKFAKMRELNKNIGEYQRFYKDCTVVCFDFILAPESFIERLLMGVIIESILLLVDIQKISLKTFRELMKAKHELFKKAVFMLIS